MNVIAALTIGAPTIYILIANKFGMIAKEKAIKAEEGYL